MKPWKWSRRRVLAVASLGLVIAAIAHPEVRYLLRAGWEEAGILIKRRPIDEAISDPAVDEATRTLLSIVKEARRFVIDSLGLDAGDTYTTFADIGRDTLLVVISASERYRLQPYRWWYPIVGSVPYKGFFRPADARRAAAKLEARGYDVYLREADAFSTLGWFEDPLLSTILDRGTLGSIATVIHEVAHNTLYVPNATPFNESFATFVGYRGAERFFQSRGDTALASSAREAWENQQRWMRFFNALAGELDSVYASTRDSLRLDDARARIFARAEEQLRRPVNNAVVLAGRFYRTNLAVFDEWLVRHDGDLRRTIQALIARVEGAEAPFAAINSP